MIPSSLISPISEQHSVTGKCFQSSFQRKQNYIRSQTTFLYLKESNVCLSLIIFHGSIHASKTTCKNFQKYCYNDHKKLKDAKPPKYFYLHQFCAMF